MSHNFRGALFCALTAILVAMLGATATAQQHITGTLQDGATYVIDVPASWNGTLLLYSHGYVAPGSQNPAEDAGDPITGAYMLAAGYALAGSSYASTGWAVQQAIPDQIATLQVFQTAVGTPTTTIAWGHSLGGMITAGLVQEYPTQFQGALPMCGVVAGGVGLWNEALDGAFVFNTLVAGDALQVVNITNPTLNFEAAESFLAAAQSSSQGQARIALAAAMGDEPGWYDPLSPEPSPTDYTTREANQFNWFANVVFPFMFALRAELEARAGGNPSWNTGVNYAAQLKKSVNNAEVQALYAAAGLSLDADLATLKGASRISANSGAEQYLIQNIIYNGQLPIPVLTLHTTGDGLVPVEDEQAYMKTAKEAGDPTSLHEVFVHRAGHCEFTPAETIVAFQALATRMASGKWKGLSASTLNNEAAALGPEFNVLEVNGQIVQVSPAYEKYMSPMFLRPFDAFSH